MDGMNSRPIIQTPVTQAEPGIAMVGGLPFHQIDFEATLDHCEDLIKGTKPEYLVTANADFLTQAQKDADLKQILFHANRVLCDGQPIVWLSRFLGCPLPGRVAGSDLLLPLLQRCGAANRKVFFLGTNSKDLKRLKIRLESKIQGLQIAGSFAPPIGDIESWDNEHIVQTIRAAQPHLLLVALGCPKQEKWIHRYATRAGVPLSIGVGASLDFITGRQIRAPKWVRNLGMEWGWRLLTNPGRLTLRYLRNANTLFQITLKHTFAQNMNTTPPSSRLPKKGSLNLPCEVHILHGRIDAERVPHLYFPSQLNQPLIIDCSGVTFIDSSGIGHLILLARLAQRSRQPFCLLNPSKPVSFIIDAVQLTDHLPSAETIRGAEALLRSRMIKPAGTETPFRIPAPYNKLDITNMKLFEGEIREVSQKLTEPQPITLDLTRVNYIDSYAIGRLIHLKKHLWEKGQALRLENPTKTVTDILKLLQLSAIFSNEEPDSSLPGPGSHESNSAKRYRTA